MFRIFILLLTITSITSSPTYNFFKYFYTTSRPSHVPRYDSSFEPDSSYEDSNEDFYYNPYYGHEHGQYYPVGHPLHNHPPGHPWHRPPQHKPTTRVPRPPPTRVPTTREPITRVPTTREPTTREPTTREPTTREPTTREPITREPTREPTTREPMTREPAIREPETIYVPTPAPTSLPPSMTTAPKRETPQIPTESPLNEYPWVLGNSETPSDGPTVPINPPIIIVHQDKTDIIQDCKSNCGAPTSNPIPKNPSVLIIKPDRHSYETEVMPDEVRIRDNLPAPYPYIILHHRFEKPHNVKDSVIANVGEILSVPVNLSVIEEYGPGGTQFANRMSSNGLPLFENLGDFIQKKVIVRNRLTDVVDLDVMQKNDDVSTKEQNINVDKIEDATTPEAKFETTETIVLAETTIKPDGIKMIESSTQNNKILDLEFAGTEDMISEVMPMTERVLEEKRDVSNANNDLVQQINTGQFNSSLLLIPAGIKDKLDPEEEKKILKEISDAISHGLVTYYQNQLTGDLTKEEKLTDRREDKPCEEVGDPYAINIRTKCKEQSTTPEPHVGPLKQDLRYGKVKT